MKNKLGQRLSIIILPALFCVLPISQAEAQKKKARRATATPAIIVETPKKTVPFAPSLFKFIGELGTGSGMSRAERERLEQEDQPTAEWLKEVETPATGGKDLATRRQEAFLLAKKAIEAGLEVTPESEAEISPGIPLSNRDGIRSLNYGAAQNYLQQALRLVPEDDGYYRNALGVAHYQQLKPRQAAALFQRAVEINPKEPIFRRNLIQALRMEGKNDALEKEYRLLVAAAPTNDEYHWEFGRFLFEQKRFAEAEREFALAIKHQNLMTPEHLTSAYNRMHGDALFEQNKFAAAETAYRTALQGAANYYKIDIYRKIAASLSGQKNHARAESILTQLVEAAKGDTTKAEILTELGETLEAQNKFAAAESAYRRALELAPTFEPAKKHLERLQQKPQ